MVLKFFFTFFSSNFRYIFSKLIWFSVQYVITKILLKYLSQSLRENIYLFIFQTTIIFSRALCDEEYDCFLLIPQIMSFKTRPTKPLKPLKGYVVSTHSSIHYTSHPYNKKSLNNVSTHGLMYFTSHPYKNKSLNKITHLITRIFTIVPKYSL